MIDDHPIIISLPRQREFNICWCHCRLVEYGAPEPTTLVTSQHHYMAIVHPISLPLARYIKYFAVGFSQLYCIAKVVEIHVLWPGTCLLSQGTHHDVSSGGNGIVLRDAGCTGTICRNILENYLDSRPQKPHRT